MLLEILGINQTGTNWIQIAKSVETAKSVEIAEIIWNHLKSLNHEISLFSLGIDWEVKNNSIHVIGKTQRNQKLLPSCQNLWCSYIHHIQNSFYEKWAQIQMSHTICKEYRYEDILAGKSFVLTSCQATLAFFAWFSMNISDNTRIYSFSTCSQKLTREEVCQMFTLFHSASNSFSELIANTQTFDNEFQNFTLDSRKKSSISWKIV